MAAILSAIYEMKGPRLETLAGLAAICPMNQHALLQTVRVEGIYSL